MKFLHTFFSAKMVLNSQSFLIRVILPVFCSYYLFSVGVVCNAGWGGGGRGHGHNNHRGGGGGHNRGGGGGWGQNFRPQQQYFGGQGVYGNYALCMLN